MTALAAIGHNRPPEPTPHEAFTTHIGDLLTEARNHLDGAGVQSEPEAEAVSKLLDMLRTVAKDADKARAAEKKPHDDAAKAVQARWKPLLDRCETAAAVCKQALAPWLQRKDEEQRAAAAEARRIADEQRVIAAQAAREAASLDLQAREAAEAQVKVARQADVAATRAETARPQATGGARATTLRSYWTAELTDLNAAVAHYWADNRQAFADLVTRLATDDVRGGKRTIPGFDVTEERRVV